MSAPCTLGAKGGKQWRMIECPHDGVAHLGALHLLVISGVFLQHKAFLFLFLFGFINF
jgi:hypothetical protein